MARLSALFLVSGLAALVVETTWLRWFRLLFGATAPAASATLIAFFAGHALGAALGARLAPRWRNALRAYGALELLAAAGALAVPLLLRAGEALGASRYDALREQPGLLTALRFAIALAATLPTAIAFGATLPAIGAAAVRRVTALGERGSALYGWNTLGAAAGTALAAFALPDWIGVPATYGVAIALEVGVGVVALRLARGGAGAGAATVAAEAPAAEPGPSEGGAGSLVAFAALSGFLALGAQVLLVHAFAQVLNQSVYAFGAVLVMVLLTLAGGAAAVAHAERRRLVPAQRLLGWGLATAAAAALGFPALYHAATGGLAFMGTDLPWPGYLAKAVALVGLTASPLLLSASVVLPAAFALAGRADAGVGPGRAGTILGRLAAANTVGAIAGAAVAPFVLLPGLGLWGAFAALAAVAGGGALLGPATAPRERALRAGVLALAALAIAAFANPLNLSPVRLEPGETLVRAETTAAGVVAVIERADGRLIRTDNHYVLGGTADRRHEERQGHLPLLLHPQARSVAYVGTATGITAGAATLHPVEAIFLVEIVPAVTRAARRHFGEANRSVYTDPRARVVLDDARNFLRATRQRFDVVVADLFVPWRSGTGSLYTREHFAAVRAHLQRDGLFCQWLPLYQLGRLEFEIIASTFLEVFPTAAIFRGDFYGTYPIAALVGWAGASASAAEVSAAAARLRAAGESDRWIVDPIGVWSLYVGPLAPLAREAAVRPLNTDARPRLEFLAARTHAGGGRGKLEPFVGLAWARFAERVRAGGERAGRPLYPGLDRRAREAAAAGAALQLGGSFYAAGREAEAGRALAAAAERLPDHLFARAPADPTAAEVWHDLERAGD